MIALVFVEHLILSVTYNLFSLVSFRSYLSMLIKLSFIFFLLAPCFQLSFAGSIESEIIEPKTFDLELSSDTSISISQFGEKGDRILWIPSEHGIHKERHYDLLGSVSALQYEVWLAEPHESYFIPAGRSSYTKVPVSDIAKLIQKSIPEDNRKLFIVASGRGAVLSLLALNHWQNETGGNEKFAGIVMLHPNFQATTPAPGTAIEYLSIVDSTQLPIFIIQPEKSNKYWYLQDLVKKLSDGGSQVYTQVIKQVGDGYHARPDANRLEKQKAKALPAHLSRAIKLLAKTEVSVQKKNNRSIEPWKVTTIADSLQPYPENIAAPAFTLQDVKENSYELIDYRGKVVVLNFWATWCPPCVKEIPSLGRLQKAFSKNELVVLSVDVGENKKEVEKFLNRIPADFPVLLDPDGSTVKQWKIAAFPTTFVIDPKGEIKLSYFGGLEWDAPDIVAQLRKLIPPSQEE